MSSPLPAKAFSLFSPSWPWTHSPLASDIGIHGFHTCTTIPRSIFYINWTIATLTSRISRVLGTELSTDLFCSQYGTLGSISNTLIQKEAELSAGPKSPSKITKVTSPLYTHKKQLSKKAGLCTSNGASSHCLVPVPSFLHYIRAFFLDCSSLREVWQILTEIWICSQFRTPIFDKLWHLDFCHLLVATLKRNLASHGSMIKNFLPVLFLFPTVLFSIS